MASNKIIYIIFQYGSAPVLIQRILVGFETILEKKFKKYIYRTEKGFYCDFYGLHQHKSFEIIFSKFIGMF